MNGLKDTARFVVDEAKARGADCVQCIARESRKEEFNMDGGRFSLMRTLFDREVSVTVLKGGRKGAVSINRFDEDALKAAVGQCSPSPHIVGFHGFVHGVHRRYHWQVALHFCRWCGRALDSCHNLVGVVC